MNGQDFTQTVKGEVRDLESQIPLPGATVMVYHNGDSTGAITGRQGTFDIPGVPVGRVDLRISFMGYVPVYRSNLALTTGKQLYLEVELEEAVMQGEEVVIVGNRDKTRPLNNMSMISARTFSVEESQRYAGARSDVARMATNYAGVNTANDGVNEIVIRGNSPWGLLWRMEGVDIPNPNHFGGMGTTGGPVSMLNSNVLANSDFLTGAFAAEYGNALSGVFDLRLRKGNSDNYEFLGMVGFNGFEVGAEGPIIPGKDASFLVNFRYSTMELVSELGFNVGTGTAVPEYQDITFNINVPTRRWGHFNLFGLGGNNYIEFIRSERDTANDPEDFYSEDYLDIYSGNRMGVTGLNHRYIINSTSYTQTSLSVSSIRNYNDVDSISTVTGKPMHYNGMDLRNTRVNFSFYYNKKFSARSTLRTGMHTRNTIFALKDSVYLATYDEFFTTRDEHGSTWLHDAYVEWKYKLNARLSFNAGVYGQYLALNGSRSLEPRLAMRYRLADDHSVSLAYGSHSKMQPLDVYFTRTRTGEDEWEQTNRDLDFTRAHHVVMGYDWNIGSQFRLKSEVYLQKLFDAPVEERDSYYSMLNYSSLSWFVEDSLVNAGTGINYGAELTLEKFLDNGFYFLMTTSLFDSRYRGSDQIERPTAFDTEYVFNLLGGKEFEITSKKSGKSRMWLVIDGKLTTSGGLRYLPLDVEASRETGTTIYDYDNAYRKKLNNYFRADIQVSLRIDSPRFTQEFAFYVENITNHENPYYLRYNPGNEDGIEVVNQLPLFPMMQYKVRF